MTEKDLFPYLFVIGTATVKETEINGYTIAMKCYGFDGRPALYIEICEGTKIVKHSKIYYTSTDKDAIKKAQATFNRYRKEIK